ncbi:hypothetical protein [Eupransor demetentiae]|uniref:Uncharacterized protein n=1 Tax=Eupransor demetentiae TaxID=3109584 RepID=A0ABP0EQ25_9LACO|nr:hypothetical protein R54876_GBNLAHCA_00892 [Lactobacillaceae bacterium LMG 33000]
MKNFVKFAAVTLSAAAALLTGVANKVAHADGAAPTAAMTVAVADVNVPASGEAVDVTRANPQGIFHQGKTAVKYVGGTIVRIYLSRDDAKRAITSGASLAGTFIPAPQVKAAMAVLGVGGQYFPGGIQFDFNPFGFGSKISNVHFQ